MRTGKLSPGSEIKTRLMAFAGQGQPWALPVQPSPWLRLPRSLSRQPLRQLAASMGHDVRTHMKHYGQWTDEAGLDAAFGAANAKLTASLSKRQQQMQQQQ